MAREWTIIQRSVVTDERMFGGCSRPRTEKQIPATVADNP